MEMAVQGTRRYGSDEAEPIDWIVPPGRTTGEPGVMSTPGLSEMFAYHATTMANTIRTSLVVFTRLVSTLLLPSSVIKVTIICSLLLADLTTDVWWESVRNSS